MPRAWGWRRTARGDADECATCASECEYEEEEDEEDDDEEDDDDEDEDEVDEE